ncbi:MAG: helicase-related protein [Flavobacteriales bacterium]
MTLEEITPGLFLEGIAPDHPVRVVASEYAGPDARSIIFRRADNTIGDRLMSREDEPNIRLASMGRPWSFDAKGEDLKLAAEAHRIDLAYLFDPMMAVHTSNVDPLPHQITAVYEAMLPKQPLRYVLADDPGAGKTIMAGLFIQELIMRADARRVLIIAPGSLVEQWQDELSEKFGLSFRIFSMEMAEQSMTGDAFSENDMLIARLDQLSRNDDLLEKLKRSSWDLVVFDEAHKLSASWYGQELKATKRFRLGQIMGEVTRNLLLMTATPHNGKEEDFQLFLSLLDADRFHGKFRNGAQQVDVSDVMRRMVKEDLVKFDGTRLFPERRAVTVSYALSPAEEELYREVTRYVVEEMNKADRLDGQRRGRVGFALTGLQRRLASSPEAIYQSLKRRKHKLEERLEEERTRGTTGYLAETLIPRDVPDDLYEAEDELTAEEYEETEESVVDQTTASRTLRELEAEIATLTALVERARLVAQSGQDRKWDELSKLLQNTPEMRDATGELRKLIVFTEHKDTLNYLVARIAGVLGGADMVVAIHGGVRREDRRTIQALFRQDKRVRVLVATDAAGEGVNLQNANLMVNYDLPWNPNRLEQRFGRIHRIGQDQVCFLYNMLADGTREGDVFRVLFQKLENQRGALGGRVFDILGTVIDERSLRELLIESIRYGNDPARRVEMQQRVEGLLDEDHIREAIARNALNAVVLDHQHLLSVKEEMEKAEARKLQPYFIRAFFEQALKLAGGEMRQRENGRWEIPNVPAMVRERARHLAQRDVRNRQPVVHRYERVCFEKQFVRMADRPGAPMAELMHPGHPLMRTLIAQTMDDLQGRLKQGAVLVDPTDDGLEPHLLFLLDHQVKEGRHSERTLSRRLQFVRIHADGRAEQAGWAPHLDLQPISPADKRLVADVLQAPWITQDLEQLALGYASSRLVPAHFAEVRNRREQWVDKTSAAVRERLIREINYWTDKHEDWTRKQQAGQDQRLNIDKTRKTIEDMRARLRTREQELQDMRHVVNTTPVVLGGALVIPAGLLAQRNGEPGWTADAAARSRVERLAMEAVIAAERAKGHTVVDVSAEKCGWDITSMPPVVGELIPEPRHIEVKGRAKGQTTITVTRNEMLYGLNQKEKFLLAVVIVDSDRTEGPFYIREPFTEEPGWAVASVNLDLNELLRKSTPS